MTIKSILVKFKWRVILMRSWPCLENYMEAKEISKGIQIEKEAQSLSGSSHQGGGPNQVWVHLGIQDQSALNWSPRTHTDSVFHIWMESLFDKEANSSGLASKYAQNQRGSSKQVTVQNLSGRCVAVFWVDWPCIVSGLKPKLWAPNPWPFPTPGRVLDYKYSRRRC
jgi:hypothetical protein